jgi:hypothetical protein
MRSLASILNDGWLLRLGKNYADGTSRESELRQTAPAVLFSVKTLKIRRKRKEGVDFVFAKKIVHRCTGQKSAL